MAKVKLQITVTTEIADEAYFGVDPAEMEQANLGDQGLLNYASTLEDIGAKVTYSLDVG